MYSILQVARLLKRFEAKFDLRDPPFGPSSTLHFRSFKRTPLPTVHTHPATCSEKNILENPGSLTRAGDITWQHVMKQFNRRIRELTIA